MLPLTLSLRMGAAAAEQEWLVEQALEQEGVTSAAVGGSLDVSVGRRVRRGTGLASRKRGTTDCETLVSPAPPNRHR